MRILYVGDCESTGNGLAVGLQKEGIVVDVLMISPEIPPLHSYDVIVVDLNTGPDHNIEEIQTMWVEVETPLIFLTHKKVEYDFDARVHFVGKPFTIDEFSAYLDRIPI